MNIRKQVWTISSKVHFPCLISVEREKERNEIETLQAELKALKLERDVAPKQLEKLAFELAEKEKAFGEKNECMFIASLVLIWIS